MPRLESLLSGIEINNFLVLSVKEVRINLKQGQKHESLSKKIGKYGIKIRKENNYYVLYPSDGESREIISEYISRIKSRAKEKYRDV